MSRSDPDLDPAVWQKSHMYQAKTDWEADLKQAEYYPTELLLLTQHGLTPDNEQESASETKQSQHSVAASSSSSSISASSSSNSKEAAPATVSAASVNRESLLGYWHRPPCPFELASNVSGQLSLRADGGFLLQSIHETSQEKNFELKMAGLPVIPDDDFNRGVKMKSVCMGDRWEILDAADWQNARKSTLDKRLVPRKKPPVVFRLFPPSTLPASMYPRALVRTFNYHTRRLGAATINGFFWMETMDDALVRAGENKNDPWYLFVKQHAAQSGLNWYLITDTGELWFRGAAPNGGLEHHKLIPYKAADATKVRDEILRKADAYEPPYWAS